MEIWDEEVVIVGAGIAGLATAVALKRVGIRSLVLETAKGLRTTGAALTLSANSWRALDALGVSTKLTSVCDVLQKAHFNDLDSETVRTVSFLESSSDANKLASRIVPRRAILEALAEELPAEWIRFSSKLTSIDQVEVQDGGHVVTVCLEDRATIKSKILIGCDGVHSKVANWLGLPIVVHDGRSAVRGLASYPEGHVLDHEGHQYLDKGKRAGLFCANQKELYWFLSLPFSPKDDKMTTDPKKIKTKVLEEYTSNFPSIYKEVVEHSDPSSLSWVPLMFRYPWAIAFGNLSKCGITVAGDSMHPMTPDIAQGGGCALEDAVVLGRHIANSYLKNGNKIMVNDVDRVLREYAYERRWRVTFMVATAYLVGRVQHHSLGNGNWLQMLLRKMFHKYVGRIFVAAANFDCGELPKPTSTNYKKNPVVSCCE